MSFVFQALDRNRAALDLGASPGGWSEWLIAAGAAKCVAVDPGELDPTVASKPELVHLKLKARS